MKDEWLFVQKYNSMSLELTLRDMALCAVKCELLHFSKGS
jgi:hypothetical protein